jgi:hypothetical protein
MFVPVTVALLTSCQALETIGVGVGVGLGDGVGVGPGGLSLLEELSLPPLQATKLAQAKKRIANLKALFIDIIP